MITTINEFKIFENNRADLYHAIKCDYFIEALEKNKLDTYTYQRYWEDGKRYKDDEPEYNKSFFMRGLSLTRDINYAKNWNDIILVFNQNKLKTKYKIVPYNWGFSIGGGYTQKHIKREREEFLIVSYVKKSLTNIQMAKLHDTIGGTIDNFDSYLNGFYISKDIYDIYMGDFDESNITKKQQKYLTLKNHPLFLGLI